MRTRTALAVGTACVAVVSAAVPASAATTRPLFTGHISLSGVQGSLPAGATVSVLRFCSTGSTLTVAATREAENAADAALGPQVRLASREFWPAGTVSRYRITKPVTAGEPLLLVNAALCTSTTSSAGDDDSRPRSD